MTATRFTTLIQIHIATLGLVLALLGAPSTAAAQQNRIEVNLSTHRLHVYSDGERVHSFPIASGTRSHPTPTGTFRITRIIWNPDWNPPNSPWARGARPRRPGDPNNPMQGAKLFFRYPTYYIHGTNEPHSLGSRASHGCIRMHPRDVEVLAEWVQTTGGASRSASWFEQVRRSRTDMRTVNLPQPVQVRIRR